MHAFLSRPFWIFDLDGTLTIPQHDFDAIKGMLGLPEDRPILEALDAMPAADAAPLRVRLAEFERDLAADVQAQDDGLALLGALAARGARIGILTRNTLEVARISVASLGLDRWIDEGAVLGRDCAAPKPSPDGVQRILRGWQAPPERAVMVGDFVFDVQAGRAAGTGTVWVDRVGDGRFLGEADVAVRRLDELL